MTCGTVVHQLRHAPEDHKVGRTHRKRQSVREHVMAMLRQMKRIGTILSMHAVHALSLYVSQTMADNPSLTNDKGIQRRKAAFEYIANLHTESALFRSLLQRQKLYSWRNPDDAPRRARRPNNARDDNICLDNILVCYQTFLSEAGEDVPEIKNVIKSGAYQPPEPVERLKEHNRTWADGEQGRPILSSIDENGRSRTHDAISLFYILNSHLPPSQQIAFIPQGGFGDKFFKITAEALMKVLMQDDGDKNTSLMRTIFDNSKTTLEHVNEHPGGLIHSLFFTKHLDYTRSTCLVNPDTDKRTSARDIFDVDSGT
ncbi:hypothetical protein BGX28_000726 [Mortierella sp. GBA30]|nr:hypothetical protein BGX28_000726 [Mortierella sp. GBA30]